MANGLIKSSLKTPTKFDNRYEPSFDSDGTPTCLGWKIEDVTDWVEFLGETKITFECCRSFFFLLQVAFLFLQEHLSKHLFSEVFC